jgi:hypothetical protein
MLLQAKVTIVTAMIRLQVGYHLRVAAKALVL